MMQLILSPDWDPELTREVYFRFISKEEGCLYRLASTLKKRGYRLRVARRRNTGLWICLAGKPFVPADESLNRLCLEMLSLADRYQVAFDGWDTKEADH